MPGVRMLCLYFIHSDHGDGTRYINSWLDGSIMDMTFIRLSLSPSDEQWQIHSAPYLMMIYGLWTMAFKRFLYLWKSGKLERDRKGRACPQLKAYAGWCSNVYYTYIYSDIFNLYYFLSLTVNWKGPTWSWCWSLWSSKREYYGPTGQELKCGLFRDWNGRTRCCNIRYVTWNLTQIF